MSQTLCVCILSRFSCIQLFATLWTVARQAPLFMGFSRQEYWSRLPCPPPGDFLHSGMECMSLAPPALAGGFFNSSATWEAVALVVKKPKHYTQHLITQYLCSLLYLQNENMPFT